MTGSGNHPVDPTKKTADAAATGDLSNDPEELRIIAQKVQEAQRHVVSQAKLDADVAMDADVKSGLFDVFLDEAQKVGVEESRQPKAPLALELLAQAIHVPVRRGDDYARSGELDHKV